MKTENQITFGVVIGNRGFFPAHLCESGRKEILAALKQAGINFVTLGLEDTTYGSIESIEDARKCANLFATNREKIDGILVTLPNFGDERAVANAIRWSGLSVPVLVHAFPDTSEKMTVADRRDSFCGKISVCNNLRQYGIRYSLTAEHVVAPQNDSFQHDLETFAAICRVYKGLKSLRVGMIGARPAAFNTVRFNEVLLENEGISVEPIDLSEIIHRANQLGSDDQIVKNKFEQIQVYWPNNAIPQEPLNRMAKLGAVIDSWMAANELSATAIQCWTAIEEIYGVVPCTLMSMMSDGLFPSACETDVPGVISMYALGLASQKASAIVDWNNNYNTSSSKCVGFHCSNFAKSLMVTSAEMSESGTAAHIIPHDILSGGLGDENTWGAIVGKLKPGPFTYCRISTDGLEGKMRTYLGEGRVTDEQIDTWGGYGVFEIPNMQALMHYICENGFEHHVAINPSNTSAVLREAFTKYLGWETYLHE